MWEGKVETEMKEVHEWERDDGSEKEGGAGKVGGSDGGEGRGSGGKESEEGEESGSNKVEFGPLPKLLFLWRK